MMIAFWQKPDGEEAAHQIVFKPVQKGRKGWSDYQVAMHQIMQISEVLRAEGFKLKYRKED